MVVTVVRYGQEITLRLVLVIFTWAGTAIMLLKFAKPGFLGAIVDIVAKIYYGDWNSNRYSYAAFYVFCPKCRTHYGVFMYYSMLGGDEVSGEWWYCHCYAYEFGYSLTCCIDVGWSNMVSALLLHSQTLLKSVEDPLWNL